MIKKLQKRLTLLFICSVMSIFTVVFCLFIHESIQSKKENEMYFFTRMITYLVFQLENTDDAAGDLTLTGQTYDFTLLLKNNQNAFIPVNTNHSNTDTNTLITLFEQELNKTSTDLLIPIAHKAEYSLFPHLTSIAIMEYRQLPSLRIWIFLIFMQSRNLPVLLLF